MSVLPSSVLLPSSSLLPSGVFSAVGIPARLRLRATVGDEPHSWTRHRRVEVFTSGQTVRLWAYFTGPDDAPVDPDTVSAVIDDATGEESTATMTRVSAGLYRADIVVDVSSSDTLWRWRVTGSGTYSQVAFDAFKVLPAPFAA